MDFPHILSSYFSSFIALIRHRFALFRRLFAENTLLLLLLLDYYSAKSSTFHAQTSHKVINDKHHKWVWAMGCHM